MRLVFRMVVSMAIIAGCVAIVLSDQHPTDDSAAFAIMAAVLAAWSLGRDSTS